MKNLMQQWLELKQKEKEAKEAREEIEVEMYMGLKDQMNDESQATWNFDNYKLVIKPNYTVKVNQEMAAEHSELFKTKYELSYSQYKKCNDKNIVDEIVTISQTKPTFMIVRG